MRYDDLQDYYRENYKPNEINILKAYRAALKQCRRATGSINEPDYDSIFKLSSRVTKGYR